jgi:phosphoadenosine phosphosulfate reductase
VDHLERLSAENVLRRAVERHHPRLFLACSFQKEESVLLDMLMSIEPRVPVLAIDTGVLFHSTYEVWQRLEERYGLKVERVSARAPDGRPWTAERCCGEAKVAALEGRLRDVDAWITGIRRAQAPTRTCARTLEVDRHRRVLKYNPLADWSEKQVWSYIREHELPYHPLHDRGYCSIGCSPCTVPGEGRDGRWHGQERTECGLHV